MLPDLFYIVCFSISIFASFISISVGFTIIIIVIFNRPCRTINNMMMCNTAATTIIFCILQIISAGYGLQPNWLFNQPACVFRAYCYAAVCTALGVSYAVQSINRLFFSVLYNHRSLLTWRVHLYLIIGNYVFTVLGPIPPLIIGRGYAFDIESRLCMSTSKVLYSALLIGLTAYVIPVSTVIIIYFIIIHKVRQSSRRVVAFRGQSISETTVSISTIPNLKREIKLMKNILVVISVLLCAGVPYLVLVIWNAIQTSSPPPSPLYLLSTLSVTIFITIKMVMLFYMNTDIKNVAIGYLRKQFNINNAI